MKEYSIVYEEVITAMYGSAWVIARDLKAINPLSNPEYLWKPYVSPMEEAITCINSSLMTVLPSAAMNATGWPGTMSVARSIALELKRSGLLKI